MDKSEQEANNQTSENGGKSAGDELAASVASMSLANQATGLNPNAVSFVPRTFSAPPQPQQQSHQPQQHQRGPPPSQRGAGASNGNWRTGNPNAGNPYTANNAGKQGMRPPSETEDFMPVSRLKEFIEVITQWPERYESGLNDLTNVLNSSIVEETDVVMATLVNTIVDQAIMDIYFRYNGVRLLIHLCDQLEVVTAKGTFEQMLLQRCQRETSRRESLLSATDRGQYLRGLTHLVGDIYAQKKGESLAQCMPPLLETLLKKPEKENVKCACQVLKSCGEDLERFCKDNKIETFETVMTSLEGVQSIPDDKLSKYMKEMASEVVEMRKIGWKPLPSRSAGIVNPYLNYDPFSGSAPRGNFPPPGGPPPPQNPYQQHHPHQHPQAPTNTFPGDLNGDYEEYLDDEDEDEIPPDFPPGYDFGPCGDNSDQDVCDAFEEFLKQSGQRS